MTTEGPHTDLASLLYTSLLLLALLSMAASTRGIRADNATGREVTLPHIIIITVIVIAIVTVTVTVTMGVTVTPQVSYIWLLSLTSLALWLGWVSIALILDHHYHR